MANNSLNQWSLTLLRFILGVIFTYHGYLKLFVKGGFAGTVNLFTQIGVPVPVYSALLVAVVEFACGLFLLFGLITRWASVVLIFEMLVAFFKINLKNGFLVSNWGYEFVLLILAGLLVILVNGAGKFSVGKKYFKNKSLQ